MTDSALNDFGVIFPVRDAFIQLREITENRQLIIKLIKTGQLKLYFNLKAVGESPFLIPASYWGDKGTSDFEFAGEAGNKKYLVSIARLLPTLSQDFDQIERGIEQRDAHVIVSNPVFYFWSQKFLNADNATVEWERLSSAFRILRRTFLENALKKVRIFAFENNVKDCLKILADELGKKPGRPRKETADHFWIELIKALAIVKLGAGQESVIQHLNDWVAKNKISEKIGHSLVRKRVEEVWGAASLADKYRGQK